MPNRNLVGEKKPRIVFCHGIWADGSCFSKVVPTLQADVPVTDIFSHIEIADGRIWMLPDGVKYFAGDLPERFDQHVNLIEVRSVAADFSR